MKVATPPLFLSVTGAQLHVMAIDAKRASWEQAVASVNHGSASIAGMRLGSILQQEVPKLAKTLNASHLLTDELASTVDGLVLAIVEQAQVRGSSDRPWQCSLKNAGRGTCVAGLRDSTSMPAGRHTVRGTPLPGVPAMLVGLSWRPSLEQLHQPI